MDTYTCFGSCLMLPRTADEATLDSHRIHTSKVGTWIMDDGIGGNTPRDSSLCAIQSLKRNTTPRPRHHLNCGGGLVFELPIYPPMGGSRVGDKELEVESAEQGDARPGVGGTIVIHFKLETRLPWWVVFQFGYTNFTPSAGNDGRHYLGSLDLFDPFAYNSRFPRPIRSWNVHLNMRCAVGWLVEPIAIFPIPPPLLGRLGMLTTFPTAVLEVGFSQKIEALMQDATLCLHYTGGVTRVVCLVRLEEGA
ncbi:hypothetical protein DFH27DRAFT_529219 [Peziza echinospora]|nr:hypothetical protein DFH27DRAFT_529219 [Peziza echinospora]